jgi:hypothetical protein
MVELQECLTFKIARYMFIVHTCNLINDSWIKVDENVFQRIVVELKNACIKATQTLILEL